jgi:hypothetical protein
LSLKRERRDSGDQHTNEWCMWHIILRGATF